MGRTRTFCGSFEHPAALVIRSTSQSIVHFPELGTIVAVADPGGGGGQRGKWNPPFRNLHAYFLTINNPVLAILLSSSWLEDIRGLHSRACDSSNNAH